MYQNNKRRVPAILAIALTIIISLGIGFRMGVVSEQKSVRINDDAVSRSDSTQLPTESTNNSSALHLLTDSRNQDLTVAEIASLASDSVVEITTEYVTTGNFMQQYVSSGAGSGVIITDDGYILTNNHVIEDASNITVTLTDRSAYEAELIGYDADLDVALIKINASNLNEASLGDSSKLTVGEPVVAIGNPLGQLGGTVTDGIISALDREITMNGRSMNLMQTNAAINPGNSGGGLFNNRGQLIGLVVAKSSGEDVEGLGFAIPINDISSILNDLKEYGYSRNKVSLGINVIDINNEQMAMMYGVRYIGTYIYSIEENSAAANSGLQPGDCILGINNTEITSRDDISSLLKEVNVGDTLRFTVLRNNEQIHLNVVAGAYVPENIQ